MSVGVALITGASVGIGKELAEVHARRGGEVILVARRAELLKEVARELEAKYRVRVHVLPADLTREDEVRDLPARVAALGVEVDVLINNAGFGGYGAFSSGALERDLTMVDLNIKAIMILTRHFAAEMVRRGRGRILNVGSVAGMTPGPFQATYHATKAFVNSFSLALATELEGTGVTVTLLAPGPVATEFAEVADIHATRIFQRQGALASPSAVAKLGYEAMQRGRLRVINDRALALLLFFQPLIPLKVGLRIARGLLTKK